MSNNAKRAIRSDQKSEKESEKLKGKIRELTKEVEKWKRYALSLEKHETRSPQKREEIKTNRKKKKEAAPVEIEPMGEICESCGSRDTERSELWTPTSIRYFLSCKDCGHKKRVTNG